MTVDWNKPIICKENGARLEVLSTDSRGERKCRPVSPDTWPGTEDNGYYWFRADGSFFSDECKFTVINAPEADIPHWAKVRAAELFNAEYEEDGWEASDVDTFCSIRALARYIAQHEPEPVDPDLELANQAARITARRGPEYDESDLVDAALNAIKLVRERGE